MTTGLALLAGLGLIWLAVCFLLGVTPAFVVGLVRAAVWPPRTTTDVTAPPGVRVSDWAKGLSTPASITFGPDGRLYVAE